MSARTEAA